MPQPQITLLPESDSAVPDIGGIRHQPEQPVREDVRPAGVLPAGLLSDMPMYSWCNLDDKVVDMVDHNSALARYKMCVLLLFMSFVIWDGIALNINIDLVRQNFVSITLVFYGFVVVLMLNYRNYTIKVEI